MDILMSSGAFIVVLNCITICFKATSNNRPQTMEADSAVTLSHKLTFLSLTLILFAPSLSVSLVSTGNVS